MGVWGSNHLPEQKSASASWGQKRDAHSASVFLLRKSSTSLQDKRTLAETEAKPPPRCFPALERASLPPTGLSQPLQARHPFIFLFFLNTKMLKFSCLGFRIRRPTLKFKSSLCRVTGGLCRSHSTPLSLGFPSCNLEMTSLSSG